MINLLRAVGRRVELMVACAAANAAEAAPGKLPVPRETAGVAVGGAAPGV